MKSMLKIKDRPKIKEDSFLDVCVFWSGWILAWILLIIAIILGIFLIILFVDLLDGVIVL